MRHLKKYSNHPKVTRPARLLALAALVLCAASYGSAQDIPFISGGGGFVTNTTTGDTSYSPTIEPLVAVPVGQHLLIESRAILFESWFPRGGGQPGYDHDHLVGLSYLQGDYLLSRHFTLVGGSYLLPFGTYIERLSPIWISNFQDGPLSTGIGGMGTGTGLGGMVRGDVISRRKYSVNYATYFSARSNNKQFSAERSAGGRVSLYLPDQGLEVGVSYSRLLQGVHENFFAPHVWWEPKNTGFRVRSEFDRGQHAQGYWIESDYRLASFGGADSLIGRFQPLFRMQQTFRLDKSGIGDGVPSVNTQRVDFGLNYNLPHETRILTSYSRQFSSTGNQNIWETGIVYRFLFPTWKGK